MRFVMGALAVLAAVTGVGCGLGTCTQRNGTYTLDFTERSGDCGPVPEQVLKASGSGSHVPDGCVGNATDSSDLCKSDIDAKCPLNVNGATYSFHEVGTVNWDAAGDKGTGVLQADVYDPSGASACHSTYDIVYARQ